MQVEILHKHLLTFDDRGNSSNSSLVTVGGVLHRLVFRLDEGQLDLDEVTHPVTILEALGAADACQLSVNHDCEAVAQGLALLRRA